MKIELIAVDIEFTVHSIVYTVRQRKTAIHYSGITVSCNDIKDKDLLLKPTFLDKDNMEVVFAPVSVKPSFYQDVQDRTIRNHQEYKTELNSIYKIGDTVGYLVI
jgi:hypothetical protein